MSTRSTIEDYFEKLSARGDWQSAFADDVRFASRVSPNKEASGKATVLQATQRFYGSIGSVEVRDLLVDGDRACALTRYEIRPPNGAPAFSSDVAELFVVRDGRIASLETYFDTAPYPK